MPHHTDAFMSLGGIMIPLSTFLVCLFATSFFLSVPRGACAGHRNVPNNFTTNRRRQRRTTIHLYTQYGIESSSRSGHLVMSDGFEQMTEAITHLGVRRDLGIGVVAGIDGHPLRGHYDAVFLLSTHVNLFHPVEVLLMGGLDLCFYPEVRPALRAILHATIGQRAIAPAVVVTMNIEPEGSVRNSFFLGLNVSNRRQSDHFYLLAQATTPLWNQPLHPARPPSAEDQGWSLGISLMHIHDFL